MQKNVMNIFDDVKRAVKRFFSNYWRVFRASKSTAVLLIICFGFLGLAPFFEIYTLGKFIDAIIGARGINVWTSDISKYMWHQIGIVIACAPALLFAHQAKGIVKKLGRSIFELCLITSLFIAALPIAPILLFVILITAFVVEYFRHKLVLVLYSAGILLLMAANYSSLIFMTVQEGIMVGELILYGGSLLAFSSYLALRPYLYQEKNI